MVPKYHQTHQISRVPVHQNILRMPSCGCPAQIWESSAFLDTSQLEIAPDLDIEQWAFQVFPRSKQGVWYLLSEMDKAREVSLTKAFKDANSFYMILAWTQKSLLGLRKIFQSRVSINVLLLRLRDQCFQISSMEIAERVTAVCNCPPKLAESPSIRVDILAMPAWTLLRSYNLYLLLTRWDAPTKSDCTINLTTSYVDPSSPVVPCFLRS